MRTISRLLLLLSCIYALSGSYLFADIIDEFAKYSYDKVFTARQTKFVFRTQEGQKIQTQQMLLEQIGDDGKKVIYTKNKLQHLLFLVTSNSDNSWMLSNKVKRPLKIALGQRVTDNMNVQDFAGLDIRKDFTIEKKISSNEYLLRSTAKKLIYPYTTIKKEGEYFLLIHHDKNQKPYKEVRYFLMSMNGKTFWQIEQVRDLIFPDVPTSYVKLLSFESIRIPSTLLSFHHMGKLFVFFQ